MNAQIYLLLTLLLNVKVIHIYAAFEQPLMADCGHTACADCWKVWLKRSRTCPTCRKHTTMDSLATMVFEKVGVDSSSLTQLCESDSDDELEITVST